MSFKYATFLIGASQPEVKSSAWRKPAEHAATRAGTYRKALSIAREQHAKLWELRAARRLAGLRRDEGRCAETRDLLAGSTAGSPKASILAISKSKDAP